jgi:O-antigen/teichoic acid export membrane protein
MCYADGGDMPVVRNLLTGTATKYVLLVVNIAAGVLLLPFTLRHLGTDQYGLWMLAASFTYYLQLLDLGYGAGVVRHVTDADARGDIDGVNRVLSTFLVVFSGLGVIALVAIAGLVVWIVPRFPRLTPEQVRDAQLVLALLGVRVAIGLPMSVFGAATTARQRFALNNSVAIVFALLNAIVTFVVLSLGFGLIPLVASTSALGVLSYAAYARTARIALPAMRLRPSLFSPPLVREVTSFSVYLFVIGIAANIWFNLDSVVIGAALGTSAVAIYAVAFRIADFQRQLCSQFNDLLFPVVVRMGATETHASIAAMLVDSTRIALSLVTIVSIGVIAFGAPLIEAWVGPGFEGAVLPRSRRPMARCARRSSG